MFRCSSHSVISILALASLSVAGPEAIQAPSTVVVERHDGRFRLIRNGQPFAIKGVGGESRFAELVAAGGNSVRAWGADNLAGILEDAEKHGLTVCAGLWLEHQRHGFDYEDQTAVQRQLEEKLTIVRKYKDHPALLMWGVGNEVEGEGKDPSIWHAVNHLAREIKRIDPKIVVVMLTAKTEAADRFWAKQLGADEYLNKPIDPVVLVQHVEALLAKSA